MLDEELLSGVVAAETHLRPARAARMLDAGDWDGAVADVRRACQLWGGVADLLVPVVEGVVPDPYTRLLRESELDGAVGAVPAAVRQQLTSSLPRRAPALLALGTTERDELKELEVCGVRPRDPWALAYLAAVGTLPRAPDPEQLAGLLLRDNLTFEDVVRVRRVTTAEAGAKDLIRRLRNTDCFSPVAMSLYRLRGRPARTTQAALDGWLEDRYAFARQQGPGIVVVYTPHDASDLCLIWNLRALHGWPAGLPLAVPMGEDAQETARTIQQMLTEGTRKIVGRPVLLTSATIDDAVLTAVARLLGDGNQPAEPAYPQDVLQPARPPARTSAITLAFEAGAAIVATRNDRDRQDLTLLDQLNMQPDLRLTVQLPQDPLPPVRSLDGGYNGAFAGGGCVLSAGSDRLAELHWPSGFSVLRAAARDRGVDARPSASGRTAMALLSAVGSLQDVVWLAHRPLLGLLYKKAASSGMSWWKQRAADQAAVVSAAHDDPTETADRLLAAIEHVSVSHGGESAATLNFSDLSNAIGHRDAAAAWLEWAERRTLLVRGATVKCPRCQHEGWRPFAELAPPITCPGCRTENDRPFTQTAMPFSYRLGETLRRAIENDSIYHLLAMRTLATVLEAGPDKLVGAHPGVDFMRDGRRAEADVVVVLSSGAIVPAEVKARSTGIRRHDLDQFDLLAEWLDVATVVLATGDDDTQLSPEFRAAARVDLSPWRRLLTADDMLDPVPTTTFGTRYPGTDADQHQPEPQARQETAADHDKMFADRLRARAPLDSLVDPTAALLGPYA